MRTWLSSSGLDLGRDTIHVAPPLVDWVPDRSSLPSPALKIDVPYFVIIGTIEPRKNHLLLLHLWRNWIKRGSRVPKLLIIGKRGWENDVVFNMLGRCEVLRGHVMELGALPQKEMFSLLAGARALLMPSFAEGLGLPVLEAISMGVPVLASDIPAFQEIGDAKGIALFHPLDMRAWQKHIAIQAR